MYVVFIWMPILFSFIPVNVTLLLFPSRTCTTTNTTTTTTDDEKTNRNVWCSLISLSLLLSFLPELSYGFLFLSILSCFFFAPSVLSLSLSLSLLFARIIRVEDKESNFASTRRQTNQRKNREREKENKN